MRLLLDTNVWLDNYLPDRPKNELVGFFISTALSNGHELLYPALSAKDLYYLICNVYKRAAREEKGKLIDRDAQAIEEIAWACVSNMGELATPVGVDMSDLWFAGKLRGVHADFEDDLVLAAAARSKADYLVTSDEQLIKHATCAALTPEDMLAALRALDV